uniref:AAA domain (Cdc48 subfamily) n=1 Tax=Candidatus Kentrum sp. DK TaxID=2126562 RepID=A0A450T1V5_9GAMM|nr:MAG: AAA domain (Cdc48 subfamily) [Candidatus Kentron sp. DK]
MNNTQTDYARSVTGWKSRIDVALTTVHRVVLQGNVLDAVLDENQRPVGLVDWLVARLRRADYQRIVFFDHGSDPIIHHWENKEQQEGLSALMKLGGQPMIRRKDPSDPLTTLGRLHYLLADPLVSGACILMLQEHRFRSPSPEAMALHRLAHAATDAVNTSPEPNATDAVNTTDSEEGGVEPPLMLRNLAILLYPDENLIPADFLRDPDTAIIRLPYPGFSDRFDYFRHNQPDFYRDSSAYDPQNLARITEGARLSELQQLARLSQQEQVGVSALQQLQDLLRFGKRENPWATIGTMAQVDEILAPVRSQHEAVDTVKDALLQGKWGVGALADPGARRPPLICFFVGGTGVGKTMMARRMAHFLTGSADGLKVIDMSEYRQDHSVQRLIGAPPSYIGFSEGGQLTNWVKERPFSLVLFDEIEKAHERILDIFLQILDGARLTDGKGETVDFSQTGLIFTSNIGTDALAEGGLTNMAETPPREKVVEFFTSEVRKHFEKIQRPEIYNRLKSGIVVFNFILQKDAKADITDKLRVMTQNTNGRLQGGGRIIEADDEVIEKLLRYVDYQRYGLRDVNNVLVTRLSSAIARFLDFSQTQGFNVTETYCYRWDKEKGQVRIVRGTA